MHLERKKVKLEQVPGGAQISPAVTIIYENNLQLTVKI